MAGGELVCLLYDDPTGIVDISYVIPSHQQSARCLSPLMLIILSAHDDSLRNVEVFVRVDIFLHVYVVRM